MGWYPLELHPKNREELVGNRLGFIENENQLQIRSIQN